MKVQRASMAIIVGLAVGVAGCGGGSDGGTTAATSAAGAQTTTAAPAPATVAPGRPGATVPQSSVPTLEPSPKAKRVSLPAGAVAKVGDQVITQAQYDRLRAASVGLGSGPVQIVSDPPRYTKCIASLRAFSDKLQTQRKAATGASKQSAPAAPAFKAPSTAALRNQCRQRRVGIVTVTMSQLIRGAWTAQQAKTEHVSVSNAEVAKVLAQQRKVYPSAEQYRRFLKSSGLTAATMAERTRTGLLSQKLALKRNGTPAKISDDQVAAYFAKNKAQFGRPERRDLQVILTKTQAEAQAAQAAIKQGTSWKAVAAKYSIDRVSKATGGSYPSAVKGALDPALAVAFSTRMGEVAGPVHGRQGFWIVRVTKIYPAVTPTIGPYRDQIRQLLQSQAQGKAAAKVNTAFQATMKAKTLCRAGYVVAALCANG